MKVGQKIILTRPNLSKLKCKNMKRMIHGTSFKIAKSPRVNPLSKSSKNKWIQSKMDFTYLLKVPLSTIFVQISQTAKVGKTVLVRSTTPNGSKVFASST